MTVVLDGTGGVVVRRPRELPATVGALAHDPFRREALGQGALDRVLSAHAPHAVAARLDTELTCVARSGRQRRRTPA